MASPTTEKTYYVDVNHPQAQDDNNHGSFNQPWKTIEYAIQQTQLGDVVLVRGGVYDEKIVRTWHSGAAQAPITIKNYGSEKVIWQGGQDGYLWHLIEGQYWIIDGIIFENAIILGESHNEVVEHIIIRNSTFRNSKGGILAKYTQHILIDNCYFVNIRSGTTGVDANAIGVPGWIGDDITIRNSRFEDIGSDGIHLGSHDDKIGQIVIENNEFFISGQRSPVGENGIDIKGVQGPIHISGNVFHGFRKTVEGQDASGANGEALNLISIYPNGGAPAKNVIIEQNLFYDNRIHLWISRGSHDILVKNNIFRDAYNGADHGLGLGVHVHDATDVQILHNTFFNNAKHVRSADLLTTSVTLKNNIFAKGSLDMPPNDSGLVILYSDYNAYSDIVGDIPPIMIGDYDIIVKDLYLDTHLYPLINSPVVDVGDNLGVSHDFDEKPRYDGLPDLGAFENEVFSIFLPLLKK